MLRAGLLFSEGLLAESCLCCSMLLTASQCCCAELCFKSSTRMKPNWLVFMLRLSTGDTVYVQYLVPTLIMSRQSDQLPKVMCSIGCCNALQSAQCVSQAHHVLAERPAVQGPC